MDRSDLRLSEAQQVPLSEIAERLAISGLRRGAGELVGPCPNCGGRDRFSINPRKGVWNCRHGCVDGVGADGIGLVRLVLACDFPSALDWLVGRADVTIDPAVAVERERKRQETNRRREAESAQRRKQAIDRARDIWAQSVTADGTDVERYLQARGFDLSWFDKLPAALRFHPALPYMVPDADRAGAWSEIHRGPAMVAAVTDLENRVTAVHRTWIDPDAPKGKAVITYRGERQDVKKIWGHKKGCAIRLGGTGPRETLIMGEGIETTLTARAGHSGEGVHFWAGIDLGNMAGRRQLRGQGMKYAGLPDLEDLDAFVPPIGVKTLVFVQDGDSDAKLTRAKLLAGLRRARALVPTVECIRIVHAGDGRDLNDMLMEPDDE